MEAACPKCGLALRAEPGTRCPLCGTTLVKKGSVAPPAVAVPAAPESLATMPGPPAPGATSPRPASPPAVVPAPPELAPTIPGPWVTAAHGADALAPASRAEAAGEATGVTAPVTPAGADDEAFAKTDPRIGSPPSGEETVPGAGGGWSLGAAPGAEAPPARSSSFSPMPPLARAPVGPPPPPPPAKLHAPSAGSPEPAVPASDLEVVPGSDAPDADDDEPAVPASSLEQSPRPSPRPAAPAGEGSGPRLSPRVAASAPAEAEPRLSSRAKPAGAEAPPPPPVTALPGARPSRPPQPSPVIPASAPAATPADRTARMPRADARGAASPPAGTTAPPKVVAPVTASVSPSPIARGGAPAQLPSTRPRSIGGTILRYVLLAGALAGAFVAGRVTAPRGTPAATATQAPPATAGATPEPDASATAASSVTPTAMTPPTTPAH